MTVASPLSVFIETTSVSLVADIEADSHPDLPSVHHTSRTCFGQKAFSFAGASLCRSLKTLELVQTLEHFQDLVKHNSVPF